MEQAFRGIKTVDLKVRPIQHHLLDRVVCHILFCVLADYGERHLRDAWQGLTYAVPDLERDPVLPSKRSEQAQRKAQTHLIGTGLPVHSFQTLLEDLTTCCRNTGRRPGSDTTFSLDTLPSEVQATAQRLVAGLYLAS